MRRRAVFAFVAVSGFVAVAASSCSGCYYLHVGYGQAKVLCGRKAIDDILASDALTPEERARLALVPKVRAFAQERLGLARNGSYTTFYDSGTKPVSWNVTACEATSFTPYEWWFPFVGAAAYKGFFDLEEARAEAAAFAAEGYDVTVREVGAYSTLGWFDDPVFRRMLAGDVHDLANTIIHELTHATVFKRGDLPFNESVATFVGDEGTLAFLEAEFGPGSEELARARDAAADERVFAEFIDALYARLDDLYRSGASDAEKRARRAEIFAAARTEFEALRKEKMRDRDAYAGFAKRPLNNAVILGYRHYHTGLDALAQVRRLCGGDLKAAINVFREAAESDSPRDAIDRWRAARAMRSGGTTTRATRKPTEKGG